MKNILLPILFLFFGELSFGQSVDLAMYSTSVTQIAVYPEWMTETLDPSMVIIKDSLIDLDIDASFKIVQLADNAIIHEEIQTILSISNTQQSAVFAPFTITDLPLGDYQIQYEISSAFPDDNLDNNFFAHNFRISEDEFAFGLEATDFIYPSAGNYDAVEPHAWAYACPVQFQDLPDGSTLGSMNFTIGNAQDLEGQFTPITIYVWDEDSNGDASIDPSERRLVAFGAYTVTGDELPGENISMEVLALSGEDWEIEENKIIIFSFEHVNNLPNTPMKLGVDNNPNLINPNYIIPAVNPFEDYGRVYLGHNGDLTTEPYIPTHFIQGFNGNLGLSLMPLPAAGFTIKTLSNNNETQNEIHSLKLLENPVTNQLRLKIDSSTLHAQHIIIFNTQGQVCHSETVNNQNTEQIISVASLPSGTYHILVKGERGQAATTFIKM